MFRNNVPESYDYLVSYCMGIMKNMIFFPPSPVQANWNTDYMNYLRYCMRMMNAEEII